MRRYLFILFMLALCPGIFAQNAKISVNGRVTDAQGVPVVGASVVVKEHPEIGTVTGSDGKFTVQIPPPLQWENTYCEFYRFYDPGGRSWREELCRRQDDGRCTDA